MSEQPPPEGERVERVEIVYELQPSAQRTYEYEREDGTVVHGDASGEWALDENGEVGGHRPLRLPTLDGLRAEGHNPTPSPSRALGHWGLLAGTVRSTWQGTEQGTP